MTDQRAPSAERISEAMLDEWEAIDDAFCAQASELGLVVSDKMHRLIRELRTARAEIRELQEQILNRNTYWGPVEPT